MSENKSHRYPGIYAGQMQVINTKNKYNKCPQIIGTRVFHCLPRGH